MLIMVLVSLPVVVEGGGDSVVLKLSCLTQLPWRGVSLVVLMDVVVALMVLLLLRPMSV